LSWQNTNLKPGDMVIVERGISATEIQLLKRVFKFERYTKPHNYAVISDEHGSWHVHPECLERKIADKSMAY
jgi:hypothetical protein